MNNAPNLTTWSSVAAERWESYGALIDDAESTEVGVATARATEWSERQQLTEIAQLQHRAATEVGGAEVVRVSYCTMGALGA